MSIKIKSNEDIYWDRWEVIAGNNFNCRVLISPYNKRITVYEFNLTQDNAAVEMVNAIVKMALENDLDKIWLKSESQYWNDFSKAGMYMEAFIPGYYKGEEKTLIFALYLSRQRQTPSCPKSLALLDKMNSNVKYTKVKRELPEGITIRWGSKDHCFALASLYSKVFTTYPFPVFDPGYLKNTMNENNTYYITAWHKKELIAASSAEINRELQNAEITDFATLSQWRGRGLASFLLAEMENRLLAEGFRCLYTIARSSSTGMNSVFFSADYNYYGVLINNCNIGIGFEDMNVWAKLL
ncbi:MAG: putative beta-lysine N-acetyltransferase [Syntrophomonas sp.]|nr:putative beta-lysine N-acetyltransferase [Syntrophomonas sp.]